MGVRYTNNVIKYKTDCRVDTSAHLIADIDSILSAVASARVSVTGGFKYTLVSPDNLSMKVWVQDLGDSDPFHVYIRITATSTDESITGVVVLLDYGNTGIVAAYEVWANICQFFIAPTGVASNFYNFGCGVIGVPSDAMPCTIAGGYPEIDEMWWASAADNVNVHGGSDFRIARYDTNNWCLCFNGALVDKSGVVLNMMPLAESINVDYAYGTPPYIKRYHTEDGLRIDTLISVGGQIYGQMFDAHTYTIPDTLDAIRTLTDVDTIGNPFTTQWLVWNNSVPSPPTAGSGTVLGTLMLLLTSPPDEVFVNTTY